MNKVRIGIIGMGNMGRYHADYLLAGKVNRAELVAVCSTSRASWRRARGHVYSFFRINSWLARRTFASKLNRFQGSG